MLASVSEAIRLQNAGKERFIEKKMAKAQAHSTGASTYSFTRSIQSLRLRILEVDAGWSITCQLVSQLVKNVRCLFGDHPANCAG